MREVPDRIVRLPDHYFTALLAQVAAATARGGEPLADLGRGNPEVEPPEHVVRALTECAEREGIEAQSEGTFFVWFRPPDGVTVDQLVVEHRVAVAPGEGFGARGAGWARLSLAVRDEILDRGLERLRAAFA
jgi:aspartate/methionine/tyrosine aminotransferase